MARSTSSAAVLLLSDKTVVSRPSISLAAFSLLHTPPVAMVQLASEIGYDQVGVRLAVMADGVDHQLLGRSPARQDLKRALDDTGMSVLDVEAVVIVDGHPSVELGPVLEAAADLDAHLLDVLCFDTDARRALAAFNEMCDEAAAYGVSCHVEFVGFSAVPTLQAAQRMMAMSNADNCGVLLDPLHLIRTGGSVEDIALLPRDRLPFAQLCDARHARPEADLRKARQEALSDRLPPGAGELPLVSFLQALPRGTALSVEVPLRVAEDESQHARALYNGAQAVIDVAAK